MFIYDRFTGRAEQMLTGKGEKMELDPTGRFVLFQSRSDHFVDGIIGAFHDVFLFDRHLRTTVLMSHAFSAPVSGNYDSIFGSPVSLSDDGQTAIFDSPASDIWSRSRNLIPGSHLAARIITFMPPGSSPPDGF